MAKYLGLKYIYGDVILEEIVSISIPDFALQLHSLDSDTCAKLKKAVVSTDAANITILAKQLQIKHPALALVLQNCAQNFDYETILTALQCDSTPGGIL